MPDDNEDQAEEDFNIIGLEPDGAKNSTENDSNDDGLLVAEDFDTDEDPAVGDLTSLFGGDLSEEDPSKEPDTEGGVEDFDHLSPVPIGDSTEVSGTAQAENLDTGWTPALLTRAKTSLDDWAARWAEEGHPYVKGLSEALPVQRNMTMWASLNPFDLLPHPKVTAGAAINRVARVLSLIRNVAVFIPVAITWWAINVATSKFGEFAQSQKTFTFDDGTPVDPTTISFLTFWENGFGLLDDGLISARISHIALIDFAIIASIVALTLFSSALSEVADRRTDREEELADAHRSDIALVLTDALEGKRSASPESIAGSIADVLNDLVDAARQVRGAALQLEQSSEGVASFNSRIEELNQGIRQLSDQVTNRVSGQIVQAVNDLGRSVEELNTSVAGDTSRLMTDIITGLEEVGEQLARTGASVEFGTRKLLDDLDGLGRKTP